jgi:eukaryotic-like serine/threonine-protein kinase
VVFIADYRAAIDRCKPWLSMSYGSTVPEDFEQIRLIKFEPVFIRPETTVKLKKRQSAVQLKMVGEGSHAIVYSFIDPDHGIKFAVKRAKKDLEERDLYRFRQEFEVLKRLSFPYIVEVYQYDETRNEYKLEYCDETLRDYIARRNNKLSFASRKLGIPDAASLNPMTDVQSPRGVSWDTAVPDTDPERPNDLQ